MHHAGTKKPVVALLWHKLGVGTDPVQGAREPLRQDALDHQVVARRFKIDGGVVTAQLRMFG